MRPSSILFSIKITLIVVGTTLAITAVFPKARLFLVWAAGRNQGCTMEASLNSHDALLRFAKRNAELGAQSRVIQRDASGFELVETPRGRFWNSRHEPLMGFLLAEQEAEIYGDPVHGVKAGDVVLDCGADIGVFTRMALTRGARLVVAVEPAPSSAEALQKLRLAGAAP